MKIRQVNINIHIYQDNFFLTFYIAIAIAIDIAKPQTSPSLSVAGLFYDYAIDVDVERHNICFAVAIIDLLKSPTPLFFC